jgi:signal transduction histidine kinase
VATYSPRQGFNLAGAVEVLASRDGSLWINDNFQALDVLRDGQLTSLRPNNGLPGKHVSTFHEDAQGRLWVGIDNDLWVYAGGAFRVIRRTDGGSLGIVFSIAEDTNHDIWVRAGPNLDRIHNFSVSQEITSKQVATSYILAATIDGGVIIGRVNGDLVKFHNGETQVVASNEVGNSSQIRDLLVQADGSVWGTTIDELFRLKDGVRRNLTTRNGLPCDGIFSLVEDASRAIWLYSQCGLIKIERAELDRWWDHPNETVKVDLLDAFDGVEPGLTSLKPQSTRTPDGRLWFANVHVVQMLDPQNLTANRRSPPVHIQEVVADRKSYSAREGLRLPPLTRDLEINYSALSFVVPQKVRFRYKLEGHDADWREPGTRRQAVYNDLDPGQYRFRVLACNNDGVWNETGAAFGFIVAPAYYQTAWFRILIFSAAAGLLWLAYLYRLRYATARIQERLAARLEERERIARELHDTLLQGFHGLMLRFQAVLKNIPSNEPAHQMLERALVRGDEVLLESREHVQGIRGEGNAGKGLPEKIERCGEELADIDKAQFRLTILGTPREINPAVCDDMYQIGREALVNAFRHAHAANIEADITFDRSSVRLTVRDDGAGIDQAILNGGRAGHWGLSGMRERARRIGGQIRIWSLLGAGTEVELIVSANIAYPRTHGASVWKRSRSLDSEERKAAKP